MPSKRQARVAQGTIEYLVIVAVVVVLGLLVVGLFSDFFSSPVQGVLNSSGSLGSVSGGIIIKEGVLGEDGNGLLSLQNGSGDSLSVSKVVFCGSDNNFDELLGAGDSMLFPLSDYKNACSCVGFVGKKKSIDLSVAYTTASGLEKTAVFTVTVDCVVKAVAAAGGGGSGGGGVAVPVTPPDTTPPSVSLSSPDDNFYTTNPVVAFNFHASDNVDINRCSLLVNNTDVNELSPVVNNATNEIDYNVARLGAVEGQNIYSWDVNCTDSSGNTGGSGIARDLNYYQPMALTPYVWVTNNGYNVTQLDALSGRFVAMQGTGVLGAPSGGSYGVAVAADGNVWVTNDTYGGSVSKIRPSDGAVLYTFLVGQGARGIAIGPDGNAWVASDAYVFKIDTTYSGPYPKSGGDLSPGPVWGQYWTGGVVAEGVVVDAGNHVWVTSTGGNSVVEFDGRDGGVLGTYTASGHLSQPLGVAVDGSGNIWVASYGNNSIAELDGSGNSVGGFGAHAGPYGLAVAGDGNLWVAESGNNTVSKYRASDGNHLGTYTVGSSPVGVAVDGSGDVWVANSGDSSVSKLNGATGAVIGTYTVGITNPIGFGDMTGYALQHFVLGH